MDSSILEFRDKHALLLTELKRLTEDGADEGQVARGRELRIILRVVARSFLREHYDPAVSEAQLMEWLNQLEAA